MAKVKGKLPVERFVVEEAKERAAASGKTIEVIAVYKSGRTKSVLVYPCGKVVVI